MKGIYTLANDNELVINDTMALLNSLFAFEQKYPVILIPYTDEYHKIASLVAEKYNVQVYDNKDILRVLDLASNKIFGKTSHLVRKFACWFGPFDEFIYYDTDIVVLQDQKDTFDLLKNYDFVRDGSIKKMGIKTVFTEKIYEKNIFPKEEIKELFNAGFFASRKGVINYDQLMQILEEAAELDDIFAMPNDQPLLNYMMLKHIPNRANLRILKPASTDAWAGVKGMQVRGNKIYENDGRPVRYVHWAGIKPISMRPYVNLWLKYRYPGKKWFFKRLFLTTCYASKKIKTEFKRRVKNILIKLLPNVFPATS